MLTHGADTERDDLRFAATGAVRRFLGSPSVLAARRADGPAEMMECLLGAATRIVAELAIDVHRLEAEARALRADLARTRAERDALLDGAGRQPS